MIPLPGVPFRSRFERVDRQREDISDAAFGPDQPCRARIDLQLAPQPQDLHVDAAIENILVNTGSLKRKPQA
jgi:hypothetical protein